MAKDPLINSTYGFVKQAIEALYKVREEELYQHRPVKFVWKDGHIEYRVVPTPWLPVLALLEFEGYGSFCIPDVKNKDYEKFPLAKLFGIGENNFASGANIELPVRGFCVKKHIFRLWGVSALAKMFTMFGSTTEYEYMEE